MSSLRGSRQIPAIRRIFWAIFRVKATHYSTVRFNDVLTLQFKSFKFSGVGRWNRQPRSHNDCDSIYLTVLSRKIRNFLAGTKLRRPIEPCLYYATFLRATRRYFLSCCIMYRVTLANRVRLTWLLCFDVACLALIRGLRWEFGSPVFPTGIPRAWGIVSV